MKNYREVADAVLERRDAYRKAKERRRNIAMRTAGGGGALCLMALLGLSIYGNGGMHPDGAGVPLSDSNVYYVVPDGGAGLAASTDNTASTADGSRPAAFPDSDAPNASHPASDQETVSKEDSGMVPISYSSLPLPQGQVMPDILLEYAASSQSTADVLPFSEELLSESSAILEGRITDMYLKRYTYDTYNDKFGPKEVYHNRSSSVVYELTVDKVWYGDESLTGTSVLIEDDIYLIDSYFSLKVGRSYVIPVCDLAPEKQIWEEYAGGDLTRDGRYTTLYPHHPQIEVTSDGDYIVTTDWETLCPDGASPIQLDIPENSFVEYHPENKAGEDGLITTEWRTLLISPYDMVYYYDKLKLVGANEFFIQLNRLIGQLP